MTGARLWIVNTVLVVLVLAGATGIVVGLTARAATTDTGLRTVPVGRGTVTETVTAAGTVTSALSSTLNFSTGGRIASIEVALGDRVSKGQTVATLDARAARASLTAAQAQLTSARQQLSDAIDARDNGTTTTTTTGGTGTGGSGTTGGSPSGTGSSGSGTGSSGAAGGTARSGGSSAEASVDAAQASVDQARSQVVQAQRAMDDLDLVSPQDGTVTSLDAVVGQQVGGQGTVTSSTTTGNPSGGTLPNGSSVSSGASGGASAGSSGASGGASGGAAGGASGGGTSAGGSVTAAPGAAAVMTVTDMDSLQVRASVPELDVGRVATGLPARITVNALPGRTLPGSVVSVNLLPGSGTAVQYATAVAFSAPPPGLRPGMSASVAIVVRTAGDTAFLPSVAVSPVGGLDSGVGTVQVLGPDGTPAQRRVGVGLTSDTTTQITGGLAPGDLVVLPDPATTNTFRRGGPPGTQGGQSGGGQSGSGGG